MTFSRRWARALFIVSLLLLWQLACGRAGGSRLLASPMQILARFLDLCRSGELPLHVLASLGRILGGYLLAAPLAIGLGLLFGVNERLRYYGEPLLAVLRPIPPLAWVPLAILWFGLGNGPAYFVTAIAAFFPIFTNTLAGASGVPKRYLEVARIFGAGERLRLADIVLPSALPFIATGLRVGLMVAWMSVIAAEMVSSSHGLGYFIESSQELLDTSAVMVGMAAIGLVGVAMDFGLKRLEARFLRWS